MHSLTDVRCDVAFAATRETDICRNLENAWWTGRLEYLEEFDVTRRLAENQRFREQALQPWELG